MTDFMALMFDMVDHFSGTTFWASLTYGYNERLERFWDGSGSGSGSGYGFGEGYEYEATDRLGYVDGTGSRTGRGASSGYPDGYRSGTGSWISREWSWR